MRNEANKGINVLDAHVCKVYTHPRRDGARIVLLVCALACLLFGHGLARGQVFKAGVWRGYFGRETGAFVVAGKVEPSKWLSLVEHCELSAHVVFKRIAVLINALDLKQNVLPIKFLDMFRRNLGYVGHIDRITAVRGNLREVGVSG